MLEALQQYWPAILWTNVRMLYYELMSYVLHHTWLSHCLSSSWIPRLCLALVATFLLAAMDLMASNQRFFISDKISFTSSFLIIIMGSVMTSTKLIPELRVSSSVRTTFPNNADIWEITIGGTVIANITTKRREKVFIALQSETSLSESARSLASLCLIFLPFT